MRLASDTHISKSRPARLFLFHLVDCTIGLAAAEPASRAKAMLSMLSVLLSSSTKRTDAGAGKSKRTRARTSYTNPVRLDQIVKNPRSVGTSVDGPHVMLLDRYQAGVWK